MLLRDLPQNPFSTVSVKLGPMRARLHAYECPLRSESGQAHASICPLPANKSQMVRNRNGYAKLLCRDSRPKMETRHAAPDRKGRRNNDRYRAAYGRSCRSRANGASRCIGIVEQSRGIARIAGKSAGAL